MMTRGDGISPTPNKWCQLQDLEVEQYDIKEQTLEQVKQILGGNRIQDEIEEDAAK